MPPWRRQPQLCSSLVRGMRRSSLTTTPCSRAEEGRRRHSSRFQYLIWPAIVCLRVLVVFLVVAVVSNIGAPDPASVAEHLRGLSEEDELGEGYPAEALSMESKRRGAIVLYAIGMLYTFLSLAIVCDEFFVPALEVISDELDLSPDVAGATFMAAGGSAPEFFTNLIASNVVQTDVGIGTIVGSAVFNVLFVIGCCAFVSPKPLVLTWWPLARDATFYTVDLIFLSIFFVDGQIEWYESVVLFALYISYGVFMKYSENIERHVKAKIASLRGETASGLSDEPRWAERCDSSGSCGKGQAEALQDAAVSPCPDQKPTQAESTAEMDQTALSVVPQACEGLPGQPTPPTRVDCTKYHSAGAVASFSSMHKPQGGGCNDAAKDGMRSDSVSPPPPPRPAVTPPLLPPPDDGGFRTAATAESSSQSMRRSFRRSNTTGQLPQTGSLEGSSSFVVVRSTVMQKLLRQDVAGIQAIRLDGERAGDDGKEVPISRSLSLTTGKKNSVSKPSGIGGYRDGSTGTPMSAPSDSQTAGLPPWTGSTTVEESSVRAPSKDPSENRESAMEALQCESATGFEKPGVKLEDSQPAAPMGDEAGSEEGGDDEGDEEENEPLELQFPEKGAGIAAWLRCLITLPIIVVLIWTVPDVRRPERKKYYPLTFFMSICWIGSFTYIMIWFAAVVALVVGVPITIVGLTVLAAGTSVPDLLTSVIVARQGKGDMAVSSSIGSNIFDVTIGLPIPWLIFALSRQGLPPVKVSSSGLGFSIILLLFMLVSTIMTICCNRWVMTKAMGVSMFVLYVFFIAQSILMETLFAGTELF